jgi:hypothetical protein
MSTEKKKKRLRGSAKNSLIPLRSNLEDSNFHLFQKVPPRYNPAQRQIKSSTDFCPVVQYTSFRQMKLSVTS